ncbi:MAG: hypothetical protein ACRDV0_00410, partial [Acidimicrobiales bacterium]
MLTTPGSVNWATGGLSDPIDVTAASDPVWVVISNAGRTLVTNVIEAPRLERDADLASLGWDVVAVPWFDADAPLRAAAEVAGVAPAELLSDQPGVGSDVTTDVVTERMALTGPERDDLRDLGSVVASALEAGVSSWRPGRSTDADVAAAISA